MSPAPPRPGGRRRHLAALALSCVALWLGDVAVEGLLLPALGICPAPLHAQRRRPKASIEISTFVAGAEVFIDGELVGSVPLDGPIEVTPGEHVVKVTKRGYTDFLETVQVPRSRQPTLVEATLLPISGILIITTVAPGAQITIDGQFAGETPFDGDVAEGQRLVEVFMPGRQPFRETLDIIGGETYLFELSLKEAVTPPAFYETWWFWAGVGVVVVAGGLTAAALSVDEVTRAPAADGPPRIVLPLGFGF